MLFIINPRHGSVGPLPSRMEMYPPSCNQLCPIFKILALVFNFRLAKPFSSSLRGENHRDSRAPPLFAFVIHVNNSRVEG